MTPMICLMFPLAVTVSTTLIFWKIVKNRGISYGKNPKKYMALKMPPPEATQPDPCPVHRVFMNYVLFWFVMCVLIC